MQCFPCASDDNGYGDLKDFYDGQLPALRSATQKSDSLGMIAVPDVWVDSGTENLKMQVDELMASDLIRRTIDQIDFEASDSMVEILFLRFKHR